MVAEVSIRYRILKAAEPMKFNGFGHSVAEVSIRYRILKAYRVSKRYSLTMVSGRGLDPLQDSESLHSCSSARQVPTVAEVSIRYRILKVRKARRHTTAAV